MQLMVNLSALGRLKELIEEKKLAIYGLVAHDMKKVNVIMLWDCKLGMVLELIVIMAMTATVMLHFLALIF